MMILLVQQTSAWKQICHKINNKDVCLYIYKNIYTNKRWIKEIYESYMSNKQPTCDFCVDKKRDRYEDC